MWHIFTGALPCSYLYVGLNIYFLDEIHTNQAGYIYINDLDYPKTQQAKYKKSEKVLVQRRSLVHNIFLTQT